VASAELVFASINSKLIRTEPRGLLWLKATIDTRDLKGEVIDATLNNVRLAEHCRIKGSLNPTEAFLTGTKP